MSKHEEKMGLLPIMNPLFNLREITKQMSLLEDHLNHPRKRCHDCIRKHFLTIEALFEEAISLDKENKYFDLLDGKAQEIRDLQGKWIDGKEKKSVEKIYCSISQEIRGIRKDFAPVCFDVRRLASSNSNSICIHSRNKMAKRIVATLSDNDKEDREVERLVKPSPKKKPTRKDRKRRLVKQEDKDLQGMDRSPQGDPDLNWK